jgi:N-methylhydantoinase A
LSVAVPDNFTEADKAIAGKAFDALHYSVYGHNAPNEPKVMVSLKAIGIGQVKKPHLQAISKGGPEPIVNAQTGARQVYRGNGQYEKFRIFRRERLLADNVIHGPAIVEEVTATTIIESDRICTVDQYGNLVITRK